MIKALEEFRRSRLGPILGFVVSLRAAAMVVWLAYLFPATADLSFPEGSLTVTAWNLSQGAPAYTDWREWPHRFAPYGPLTYYPVGMISRIVPGGTTPRSVVLVGRAQSCAALVAILGLGFFIVRNLTGSSRWGLLAIPFALSWESLLSYVESYRPDAPQAAFGLLALLIALGGPARIRRLVVALLALSVAMWFKPASFGCALVLAYWCFESRGLRHTLLAFGIFGLTNLALAATINYATDGNLFLNMIHSMNNGLAPENVGRLFAHIARVPGLIYMIGLCYSAWKFSGGRSRGAERLFHFAVCIEMLTCALQLMKVGADINYLVTSYTLAALSTLMLIRSIWLSDLRVHLREAICWLVLMPGAVLQLSGTLYGLRGDLRSVRAAWGAPPILATVEELRGPVLAINPFIMAATPGFPAVMDYVQYGILCERGLLSDDEMLRRVERHWFAAIVLPAGASSGSTVLFSSRFPEAVARNYVEVRRVSQFVIYAPRKKAAAQP